MYCFSVDRIFDHILNRDKSELELQVMISGINKLNLCLIVGVFQVLALGCKRNNGHSASDVDSMKVSLELSEAISDSLFPYADFRSSFDDTKFRFSENGFNDTLVNGAVLTELPVNEKRKLLGILAKEIGGDSAAIEKFVQIFPISKFNSYCGTKQMVFVVEGDDLWGMLLVNQNNKMILNYSTLLAGGVQGGAEYEDDSIFVGSPVIRSIISSDTLRKYVIYRAERMLRHPQDSLKTDVISDTGLVLLRLTENSLDTLGVTGAISVDSFVKYKISNR